MPTKLASARSFDSHECVCLAVTTFGIRRVVRAEEVKEEDLLLAEHCQQLYHWEQLPTRSGIFSGIEDIIKKFDECEHFLVRSSI